MAGRLQDPEGAPDDVPLPYPENGGVVSGYGVDGRVRQLARWVSPVNRDDVLYALGFIVAVLSLIVLSYLLAGIWGAGPLAGWWL